MHKVAVAAEVCLVSHKEPAAAAAVHCREWTVAAAAVAAVVVAKTAVPQHIPQV